MGAKGAVERRRPSWPSRRAFLVGAAAALLLALAVGAAVSWHYSSAVLVPDRSGWPEEIEIEAVRPGEVVLSGSDDARRPGVYGLEWQGGHAVIGPPLDPGSESVTRPLRDLRGYLVPGMKVAFDPEVYSGDPARALGLPSRDVAIRGELGRMPAWLVGGSARTWAILVHGINGTPQVGLRVLPALRRAGLTSLLITYREDLGAPSSPDGFHHMGLTEWRDLEAAARYALDRGARNLVLVGYSMGGAIVTQFMQKSALADRVSGLVLDAPALDWQEILAFNATEIGLPEAAAKPVEWAIGARIDADWESLDAIRHPEALQLPILLFHGDDDDVVPITTSEELAAELPERVEFHTVAEAGHTQSWNVDPRRYERLLTNFLRRIGAVGVRPREAASSSPRSPRG